MRLDRGSIRKVDIDSLVVPDRFDLAGKLAIDEAEGWTIDARARLFNAAPIQRLTGPGGRGHPCRRFASPRKSTACC